MDKIQILNSRFLRKPRASLRLAHAGGSLNAFLNSYPKSGRTWLRFILANYFAIIYALGVEVNLDNLFSIIPNFDFDPARGMPGFKDKEWPSVVPLVAVSHHPYDRITFGRRRTIFMVRDPRDVMVSAYFHQTYHKHRFSGDVSEFLRNDQLGISALVRYLNGWAAALEKCENVVISYEKLSKGAVAEVTRVLTFLGCAIDKTALNAAVKAASFETMRKLELDRGIPGHEYDRSNASSLRMRRGKVHEFSKNLSLEEVRLIENYCAMHLTPGAKLLLRQTTIG